MVRNFVQNLPTYCAPNMYEQFTAAQTSELKYANEIARAVRVSSRIWRILRTVRKITEQRTITVGERINQ